MQEKVTRLTFNASGWRGPVDRTDGTGDSEYIQDTGFGNEDWFFRNEWEIGGWRYAFLQGVNKSKRRLLREQDAFNVLLFTVDPRTGDRFYVARVESIECLTDDQAYQAALAFKERGWLKTMRSEIAATGGKPEALGNGEFTDEIVNVRYKLSNVVQFDPIIKIAEDDPVVSNWKAFTRFQLFDIAPLTAQNASHVLRAQRRVRHGHEELEPPTTLFRSRAGGLVEMSLEHLQLQIKLLDRLNREHPQAEVFAEEDYMDVIVSYPDSLSIYEIKSDLKPLTVIRQSVGQLLEYAFFRRRQATTTKLFIVGRSPLDETERDYFEYLRSVIALQLEYVTVEL